MAGRQIGLALRGGGAWGWAHVGVLEVLERAAIPVDVIAGYSMGSVVRGLRASNWALWLRLRGRWTPESNARAVRSLLEDLGGIWIKAGQLLSLRIHLFSIDFCRELART